MRFANLEECRAYVERELERVVRSRGWYATANPQLRTRGWSNPATPPLHTRGANDVAWTISPMPIKAEGQWYGLEARMATEEFILWFGNHQVDIGGLHWFLHPAVHVAFEDLSPRADVLNIHYSLGDVLEVIIRSLEMPPQMAIRFEMNTYSLT
jgi:hypothetical protein